MTSLNRGATLSALKATAPKAQRLQAKDKDKGAARANRKDRHPVNRKPRVRVSPKAKHADRARDNRKPRDKVSLRVKHADQVRDSRKPKVSPKVNLKAKHADRHLDSPRLRDSRNRLADRPHKPSSSNKGAAADPNPRGRWCSLRWTANRSVRPCRSRPISAGRPSSPWRHPLRYLPDIT